MIHKEEIVKAYQDLQDKICVGLEQIDGGANFIEELWQRDGGGGGKTRILQHGNVIEKGGVNFSAVHGRLPEVIKKTLDTHEDHFFATGVSIVIHPSHPWIPIIHMNIRYFEMNDQVRWFGGGIDLTPHYVIEEDAHFFHQYLKKVCDQFNPGFYSKFKIWADDYFYLKHRKETRGVGGIFYDRLTSQNTDLNWNQLFEFSIILGKSFLPVYSELINRNRHHVISEAHKQWQYQRRSRYVEFNLLYDVGTKFGLETNGRVESILMSLPPQANWVYNHHPEANTAEAKTLSFLKKGISWI